MVRVKCEMGPNYYQILIGDTLMYWNMGITQKIGMCHLRQTVAKMGYTHLFFVFLLIPTLFADQHGDDSSVN